MSLRSRTLRARLLRPSRRTMRLASRPADAEARTSGRSHRRLVQLIWRRARALRLPRESAWTLHLHENHFLIRPDARVSVRMYLAAARVARGMAAVRPRLTWQRFPQIPQLHSALRRRGVHLLDEIPPNGLRRVRPAREPSLPGAAAAMRWLVTRALMIWPAPAVDRTGGLECAGHAPRQTSPWLPMARRVPARVGATERSPLRERLSQRASSLLPLPLPSRLLGREGHGGSTAGPRSSHFTSAPRLHRREKAGAANAPGKLPAWRAVAPVPLHYASPKATAPPAVHTEPEGVATVPPPSARPMQTAARPAHDISQPVLDRAATDRIADEVIRRIERRVRIERERRGI